MNKEFIKDGFILKSKGYYKHAIEAFYKALEIDNSSPELLMEIAELYHLMGKEERTLNYLEQVLEKNPTHTGCLKLLKTIFLEKNALEEAEQTAKNIYCISKKAKDLDELLEILNKEEKFTEILEYDTENPTAAFLYQKANALFCLNKIEDAETFINKALDIEQNNTYLILKGKILLRLNKENEYLDMLNQINTSKPDSPGAKLSK